jgi:hypothetical protein
VLITFCQGLTVARTPPLLRATSIVSLCQFRIVVIYHFLGGGASRRASRSISRGDPSVIRGLSVKGIRVRSRGSSVKVIRA